MSTPAPQVGPPTGPRPLRALLVEFESPGALLGAAEKVRDAGYRKWDTFSPFPVHGIDEAMGIRMTRLPWIVFALGAFGCLNGLLLAWYTNATSPDLFAWLNLPAFLQGYNYLVSGKPEFSLPANIPVIFETTVLLAAFGAVFGMFALNNLPWHHNPLFGSARFRRVTNDRFFLAIETADPKFHEQKTVQLLQSLGGTAPERIEELPGPTSFPKVFQVVGLFILTLLLIPPLVVAKARVSRSTEPRIHIIQDMDNQERFKSQQLNTFFADQRASRGIVTGTIARGDLDGGRYFLTGRIGADFGTGFPAEVAVDLAFLERGQQRFMIYCAPCHGIDGRGEGIVHARAQKLDTNSWVQPTSMLMETVVARPDGHLYNTIANGIRSMPPYGDQIPPADRWAIVAYVRALQRAEAGSPDDLTPEQREALRIQR
ncbi:MAG: DUF3341 domain-containing protein [Phycisphaerales bacterium]|nr:DUF3341 domain-containing protein [Phycisphaerales bacterium]